MGANFETINVIAQDKESLKKQWADIVQRAFYDYGHSGYSGSFAEKEGLQIMPGKWAERLAYDHALNNNPKWGPAWAYQVADDEWFIAGWCSS